MKQGDTLILLDRSRLVVVSASSDLLDSDVYSGFASLGGRLVPFVGVFILGRSRVWVQN